MMEMVASQWWSLPPSLVASKWTKQNLWITKMSKRWFFSLFFNSLHREIFNDFINLERFTRCHVSFNTGMRELWESQIIFSSKWKCCSNILIHTIIQPFTWLQNTSTVAKGIYYCAFFVLHKCMQKIWEQRKLKVGGMDGIQQLLCWSQHNNLSMCKERF